MWCGRIMYGLHMHVVLHIYSHLSDKFVAEPIWCVRRITWKLNLPSHVFHLRNYCKNSTKFYITIQIIVVKIWGFHGGDCEVCRILGLVWTDVSEERIASIFRVEKSASEEPVWAGGCRLQPTLSCSAERKVGRNVILNNPISGTLCFCVFLSGSSAINKIFFMNRISTTDRMLFWKVITWHGHQFGSSFSLLQIKRVYDVSNLY
jgi:hypothetical protein